MKFRQFSLATLFKGMTFICICVFIGLHLSVVVDSGFCIQSNGVYKGIGADGKYVECEFLDGSKEYILLRIYWTKKYVWLFDIPTGRTRPPKYTQEDYERVGWTRINKKSLEHETEYIWPPTKSLKLPKNFPK